MGRMNLISKLSQRDKEKEALEQQPPTVARVPTPPPTYTAEAQLDPEDVQQPPDLTAGFANLTITSSPRGVPQAAEGVAHLKLLECFYRLRQQIGSTDGLFGISNRILYGVGGEEAVAKPELLAILAEKRWAVYVSRAVARFERWRDAIAPAGQRLLLEDLERGGRLEDVVGGDYRPEPLKFDRDNMPPAGTLL